MVSQEFFASFLPIQKEDEQKYIAYLFHNIEAIHLLSKDALFDDTSRKLYICIETIIKDGLKVEKDIVCEYAKKEGIERTTIESILSTWTEFSNIQEHTIKKIKDYYTQRHIIVDVDEVISKAIASNGMDFEAIKKIADNITQKGYELNDDSRLLTTKDLGYKYRQILIRRQNPEYRRTLGFNCLDRVVQKPAASEEFTVLFGAKGSGKCTEFSTLVLTDKGFKKIGEYSNNIRGFSDLSCPILTKDGVKQADKFFEEEVDFFYEIKTKAGLHLKCTATHPVYTMNENMNYSYVPTESIKAGDCIPILLGTHIFTTSPQKLVYEEFRSKYKDKNIENRIKKMNYFPEYLSKELSRFLGYYIANGSWFNTISTHNKYIAEDVVQILSPLDITCKVTEKGVSFSGREFHNFIRYLSGYSQDCENVTARFKEVPRFILEGTKENQIEFLKGLMDCDSWCEAHNGIEYYTASETLAEQVQLMFINLGVFCFRHKKFNEKYQHWYHTVYISSDDFENYKELVNFESLKYNFKKESIRRKPNSKSIPFLKEYIDSNMLLLRKRLGVFKNGKYVYKEKRGLFSVGRYGRFIGPSTKITFYTLQKLKEYFELHREFHEYEEIKNIRRAIDNIIFNIYDTVESVTLIKEKIKVYDFHVPNVHNFYSNGMISHNSLLTKTLENSLINMGTCVSSFNMEMSVESNMDRLISMREGIPFDIVTHKIDPSPADLERIEKGIQRIETLSNYVYYEEPSLTLSDYDDLLYMAKKKFKDAEVLPEDGYGVSIVDLGSMIKEFSGSDYKELEKAINELSIIYRKHKQHVIFVLQANEGQIRGGKRFTTPEQCDAFTLQYEDIFGGSSYAARARLILAVNRPLLLKKRFMPSREEEWNLEEDIMWVNVVKENDNTGKLGRVPFVFPDSAFRVYPKDMQNIRVRQRVTN